jgi:hypothetical protein
MNKNGNFFSNTSNTNIQNSIDGDESQMQINPLKTNSTKEKFSASNLENSSQKKFLTMSSNLNFTKSGNSTNFLLESSFGRSNLSLNQNQYNDSNIGKKFNNTENLINDKTSILMEKSEKVENFGNFEKFGRNKGN